MTDTADLVKELRVKALRDTWGQQHLAEKTAEWQAATALDSMRAELAEAKRERAEMSDDYFACLQEFGAASLRDACERMKAAESSLAAAKERVSKLEAAFAIAKRTLEKIYRNGAPVAYHGTISQEWAEQALAALKTAGKE